MVGDCGSTARPVTDHGWFATCDTNGWRDVVHVRPASSLRNTPRGPVAYSRPGRPGVTISFRISDATIPSDANRHVSPSSSDAKTGPPALRGCTPPASRKSAEVVQPDT